MTKTHLIPDESLGGVLREYVEVDRKAEVGDYVTKDGIIRKVTGRNRFGVDFEPYGEIIGWADDYYKTLEPTDIIHVDGKRYRLEPVDSQPTDQLDVIARLTRKVAQLERENTDIKRDIERLKRKLDEDRHDIEMVIDDIVTLDERTQPEELAKKLAEAITKGLNAIDPRHFG